MFRMDQTKGTKITFEAKLENKRKVKRPRLIWLDDVEV
jgi:hypothetical protein